MFSLARLLSVSQVHRVEVADSWIVHSYPHIVDHPGTGQFGGPHQEGFAVIDVVSRFLDGRTVPWLSLAGPPSHPP